MLICFAMQTIPRALAPLVFIPGLAYETAVRLRNACYESGILSQNRLKNPVISIGNITMGGTGKTPLVISVARLAAGMGFTPAVLSRGYGRMSPGSLRIIPPGKTIPFPAMELGDEPAFIRRCVPEVWLGLGKNRIEAGRQIERQTGKVAFILDDGFQHRKLYRDLDIVVIDSSQPLESNRIFPRGSLREPATGLRRSHAVVLNGAQNAEDLYPALSGLGVLSSETMLFYCEQAVDRMVTFAAWKEMEPPVSPAPAGPVFLVAALGNPARFMKDVLKLGIRVCGTRFYRDHYRLQPGDWNECVQMARRADAEAIVITEKDAVKISELPVFPLLVAIQTVQFSEREAFEQLIKKCVVERVNV